MTNAILLAICFSCFASTASADIINIDVTAVDPSALPTIQAAEAAWEERIQFYSTEIPRAILDQLSALTIVATVAPIDGVGGILGQAGPDAIVTFSPGDPTSPFNNVRPWAVAVAASMQFDLDDFPSLEADGILQDVVEHEMGHALGFGTLFDLNGLVGPLGGIGLTQYTGFNMEGSASGGYALAGYRTEINNPLVTFVPLEQRGGPGTALGHWIDAPPFFNQVFTTAFTKEILTGFAGDIDPDTGLIVFTPKFTSNATYGAMADLGFAVIGINDQFAAPRGTGTGRWPKVTGFTADPFAGNGVGPGAGLRFQFLTMKGTYRSSLNSKGSGAADVETDDSDDLYNLRGHRWVK